MLLLDGDDFYNRSDMFEMISANIDKSGADVILFGCTDWNMKTGEKRISRSDYDLHLLNQVADQEQSLHYLLSQKKYLAGLPYLRFSEHYLMNTEFAFTAGFGLRITSMF